jgi:hypothetical protein
MGRYAVERVCGREAGRALDRSEDLCCATRNPVLAALYLFLLAASYWVYNRHVFALLPTPITPRWHRCDPSA